MLRFGLSIGRAFFAKPSVSRWFSSGTKYSHSSSSSSSSSSSWFSISPTTGVCVVGLISLSPLAKEAIFCQQQQQQQQLQTAALQRQLSDMPRGLNASHAVVVAEPLREVSFMELMSLLKDEKLQLAVAAATVLAFAGASLLTPSANAAFFDACKNKTDLVGPITRIIGVRLVTSVLGFAQGYQLSLLAEKVKSRLRIRLFSSAIRQEMAFYDARKPGELSELLAGDIAKIQRAVTDNLASALTCVAEVVGATVGLFSISAKGTLMVAIIFPVLSFGMVASNALSASLSRSAFEAQRSTVLYANEILMNPRTVQQFGSEDREAEKYMNKMEIAYEKQKQALVFSGATTTAIQFFLSAVMAGGLWYGGNMVLQDRASLSDILQFSQFSLKVGNGLANLLHIANGFREASVAAQRVFGVIERQPKVRPNVGFKLERSKLKGRIEVKEVSFAYPTRAESVVLHGVSFVMEPGSVTAIVGSSGNGKSTIAQLLQRFYDPQQGQILVDGRDIRTMDIAALRDVMGIVSQEPVLLGGSVADNIRYGKPDATDEEVKFAARQANAAEFIEQLPKGYDTPVSTTTLSAGQRQRIAISRALLKDPKILILDEATSQLDSHSEAIVQEALDRLMQGRTTLIIAHRLSTIRKANKICVLGGGGKMIEQGSHDELVRLNGMYAHLLSKQQYKNTH